MPRPQQQEIPGTEAPKIKEIEKAAIRYTDLRDERMAILTKEIAAKQALIQQMQDHAGEVGRDGDDNLVYRFGDQVVIVSDKLQVKVKAAAEAEDDTAADAE